MNDYQQNKLFDLEKDEILYKKDIIRSVSKKECILNKDGLVPYLTFPVLSRLQFIRHGFSTRLGGISEGVLGTMNLSFSRGDSKENVIQNYGKICRTLGVKTENLVFSDQVHETEIHVVREEDKQGTDLTEKKLTGVDGFITNLPEVVLCTSYADCVPLFLVDVKTKSIGLSHSGWKGTLGRIGEKTVKKMERVFQADASSMIGVIGPSICSACYEVGQDVAEVFQERFKNKGEQVIRKKQNGKYQLDLWQANRIILEQAGIKKENIHIAGICTCCNPTLLYSHRASNGKRGNLSAFLSIASQELPY